ncbi:MAG: DUF1566 domain-containing protein [Lentisphaeria bacterium]|nr:DUF1566 domain-containing protein [Lentisphaeria bacterium]
MYRKVLEKVATSLATSRTLQATCAERRKKFRKGLVAFHKRDATATSQLIKRGSELVKERHYVIAIPLFERALKLIPVQRFTVDRKGTVSDNKYGLMWVRELRSVSGNERGGMNWYEALKSVDKLSFAGLSDWRLPTEEELKHIARLTPDELKEHFPATPATGVFWSGIAEGAAAEALAVDYQDKRTNRRNKRDIYYVRPVRSPH